MNPRAAAISRLPVVYQVVLTWLDEGIAPEDIATRLGIEPTAVPALLELATAKLARAAEDVRRLENSR